ncbi:ANL family adenylate-forming protein [Oceanospirillum maris]|uniref:ANL family adenylate-forming protein n=1 Tax=Oceanospirillum maris TaxID=64977 RepID=UPI00041FAF6F|nr:fatty acid--CoA ligase family protein [Oceanospirillum maris]
MNIEEYVEHIRCGGDKTAIVDSDIPISYHSLYNIIIKYKYDLRANKISGKSVLLQSDYSVNSIGILIALWLEKNIVSLCSVNKTKRISELANTVSADYIITSTDAKGWNFCSNVANQPPLNIRLLKEKQEAGFVVFSSGSTGPSKGVVHKLQPFLEQYRQAEPCDVMLAFLLFDHIGGLATLFQVIATHGTLIVPAQRSLDEVGRCIEMHKVNTLHVSPTLLNLALLSHTFDRWNISSLRKIYYGSEPMSQLVLDKLINRFPDIELTQLYGMSEVGVLPCKNKEGDSQWIKVASSSSAVKVIEGVCHVRSKTMMMGYLSDQTTLERDVLFNTEDLADAEGDYFRIKGRKANLINVGGTNIIPTDIERVLEVYENVQDVVVYGKPHPLIGEIVEACFFLEKTEEVESFKARIYKEIKSQLLPEQIPRSIVISDVPLYSERFKKLRHEA